MITISDWDRIEAKFERVPEGGCWVWTGGLAKAGYGVVWLEGTYRNAHRAIYEILIGPVPEGKFLCHTCDNRCCVNPNHLYIGSAQTNKNDMANRGRMAVGTSLPQAKLCDEDIPTIRALEGKEHRCSVAERYKVSPRAIVHIWKRATWRHVP